MTRERGTLLGMLRTVMLMTLAAQMSCFSSSAPASSSTPGNQTNQWQKGSGGTAELDTDSDEVADVDDLCAEDPEDRDGFEDEDGCPDINNDSDPLLDAQDQCPNEPETVNGIDDEDGCPDRAGTFVAP